jgi:hypothetical protein
LMALTYRLHFFVVQAGFTEPFCDLSQMLKEALSSLHSTHTIRKWKGIAS